MDPLGQLPRGSLCLECRRQRFAVYAGVADDAKHTGGTVTTAGKAAVNSSVLAAAGKVAVKSSVREAVPCLDGFEARERMRPAISAAAALEAMKMDTGEMLKVTASTLGGMSCTVVVKLDSHVADLKRAIQENLGVGACQQQLVCGLEVLEPNTANLRSFDWLTKATSTPELLVIKVAAWTRFDSVRIEAAASAQVNGIYKRVNTNCYVKEGNKDFRMFRYEADVAWPAAWYLECGGRHAMYYAVPDQTLGEGEDADKKVTQDFGFPLPLEGWEPWTGLLSEPGELPGPLLSPVA